MKIVYKHFENRIYKKRMQGQKFKSYLEIKKNRIQKNRMQ